MRNRATDGTKINTSPSMTKKTVSTRRRAERLFNSTGTVHSTELRKEPYNPASARRKQCRRVESGGSALARLAPRWIGDDQIGERADLKLLRYRQPPRHDQITGAGTEDRGAEDAAILPRDNLRQPDGVALGMGAVVLCKRPGHHPYSVFE